MELVRLAGRPSDWDQQIQRFPNSTLFHESAWLDYISSLLPLSEIEYFEIRRGPAECIGYFCAIRVRKFGFSFWGSPFPGTGNYMGPVVESQVDQGELLNLLMERRRIERIAHFEVSNDWLDPGIMQAKGFSVERSVTHICPLTGGRVAVWARMNRDCRRHIRRAGDSGLVAERADDPEIAEEFYPQFVRLLEFKGMKNPYGPERIRLLFHHLGSADRLLALRVRLNGRVIATGFYLYDNRTLYHYESSYEPDFLQFSPNELLHWTAIQMATERGIATFNMSGGPRPSRFTQKFGGSPQPYLVYRKSSPFLQGARQIYSYLRSRKDANGNVWQNAASRLHSALAFFRENLKPWERKIPVKRSDKKLSWKGKGTQILPLLLQTYLSLSIPDYL